MSRSLLGQSEEEDLPEIPHQAAISQLLEILDLLEESLRGDVSRLQDNGVESGST